MQHRLFATLALGAILASSLSASALAPSPLAATAAGETGGPVLVAVRATPEEATQLAWFDLAETRVGDELHVVAWPGDLERLAATGLRWRVLDADLAADARIAGTFAVAGGARTTYRTYPEYRADLAAWAAAYPHVARTFDLSERTLEGRPIAAIELAIGDPNDGRPKAYFDGIHHAREWPAGELVMTFVEDLLQGVEAGDARIVDLLTRTAVIAVPVVNPDGFTISRGTPVDGDELLGVMNGFGAYWRKNARGVINGATAGASVASYGVDNNRNYPFQWGSGTLTGGVGASRFPLDATYEGTAPSSEPETSAVREVLLSNNVTAMITNHTYGNLVMWPWGHTRTPPPDIAMLESLGRHIADANGYRPQPSMDLYATTGTTDDWAYAATGVIGWTLEHGTSFHPSYLTGVTFKRSKNTEAFLRLVEAAADPSVHSVLRGRLVSDANIGEAGSIRLVKRSSIPTWSRGAWCDFIDLELETEAGGGFTWHVNPSVGPIDQGDYTLVAVGPSGLAARDVRVARGAVVDLGDITLGTAPVVVPSCGP